jgi:hypothetical protein
MDWSFLRPKEPVKFTEGSGKVMNTVPPSDFSYFELLNDVVQKEPVGALDKGEYFEGNKTYKATLPPNIPAGKFWSFTVYGPGSKSRAKARKGTLGT